MASCFVCNIRSGKSTAGFAGNIGIEDLHHPLRMSQFLKTKPPIKILCIQGRQHDTAQPLQLRMSQNTAHQPLTEPLPLKLIQHEHITQIGKCRPIGNHTRQADLAFALIQTKTESLYFQ